jgi:endoglucanase
MDKLLKTLLTASGISGYENAVAEIMQKELTKSCDEVKIDNFGNVIARKGKGKKKIMLAAHMDEIGLVVRHINKDGFIYFVKIGGIDDRILVGERVIINGDKGDVFGIIGTKAPHLQKTEERSKVIKYEDMFIDIGATSKEDAEKMVNIGDAIIFKPEAGVLNKSKNIFYGKAVDDRLGCYAMLKIMEKIKPAKDTEIYAVGTCQEEVGLKGAKTSSFAIDPDFAIAFDTTIAGDTPGISELESSLKIGAGAVIIAIEASGRGLIVQKNVRDAIVNIAKKNKIKYQMAIFDGGMTDGAMIYMNRSGIPTAVISVATRYIHSPVSVFDITDVDAVISLALKTIEHFS